MPHPTHYRSFRTHNGVCVCGWKKAGMCCWQFCPVLSIQMVAGVNQCIYVGRLAQALCVHCLEFAGRCTAQFFADCHTNTVLWMCSDRLSIGPTKASAFAGWGCYPCVSLAAAATVISSHVFASRVSSAAAACTSLHLIILSILRSHTFPFLSLALCLASVESSRFSSECSPQWKPMVLPCKSNQDN